MRFIYTALLYLLQPFLLFYLLIRSGKESSYRHRLAERYGFLKKKTTPRGVLLHSVSVGEALATVPLIRELQYRYPYLAITVTTMTPTGSDRVLSELGNSVFHTYLPYDLPCAMNRFLNTIQPKLVIVIETELWPNMISILYARKIPIILANARLSANSEKGYKKLGRFISHILEKITLVAAQSEEDGERFISLGLNRNQLVVIGNIKFDVSSMLECIMQSRILRKRWAPYRRVWIAASTHEKEEAIILKVHQDLLTENPDLLLILVPRRPERFKKVINMVQKAGFSFILRSANESPSVKTQVIIGDTMGELVFLYGISDLAFVGGSLVKHGGHNPLEAAAHAIPILMGPHTFNFKEICTKLQNSNGLVRVIDVKTMAKQIASFLSDENYRLLCGHKAAEVLNRNKGALYRLLKLLEVYLSP